MIAQEQWEVLLTELGLAQQGRRLITYRELLSCLELPAPAMRTLALALETLAEQDALAGRPLRSALVISQAGSGLPRPGFFECVQRLGALVDRSEAVEKAWHIAEVERVFAWHYEGGQ